LIFNLLLLFIIFIILYVLKKQEKKNKEFEENEKLLKADINSLHKNEKVILSDFRELYRILRRHDKNIKKQIRVEYRDKEVDGTQEE